MKFRNSKRTKLEETHVDPKIAMGLLWTSFMFLYIYVDYFHLYMPGSLSDMIAGKVFEFEITQTFTFIGLASVTIPALMIFLSVILPANLNRWTNITIATIYIPYSLFNLIGEDWPHMYFGATVEVVILILVITHAVKWPRVETGNS